MKKYFRNTKKFKGAVVVEELKRAHLVIALLSLSLAVVVGLFGTLLELDAILLTIVCVLLTVNVVISLGIILRLQK